MPIDYRIDHTRRLVVAEGRGTLTDQEVFSYQREVWSRPDVGGYDELVDMRGVEHIEMPSTDRLRELVSLAASMDLSDGASKFAIVATDKVAAELARFFGIYRQLDARSTKVVSTFASMAAAFGWLSGTRRGVTAKDLPLNFPERFPVLTTERLVLRETASHDVEAVFAMESDPVAMRYWSRRPIQDISEAQESVQRAAGFFPSRTALKWIIARPADDRMLGHLSLFNFSEQSGRADIGYGLAREHWDQGFMHEALTAVVDYAFGPLGLRRLEADVDPRNQASLRAVERLGFAREGLLRERWQVGDEISDTVLLGLLAWEWRARRPESGRANP